MSEKRVKYQAVAVNYALSPWDSIPFYSSIAQERDTFEAAERDILMAEARGAEVHNVVIEQRVMRPRRRKP